MPGHTTSVFNPKILDASVRDVAACLSENDKADLVLYAVRKLNPDNGQASYAPSFLENSTGPTQLRSTATIIRPPSLVGTAAVLLTSHVWLRPRDLESPFARNSGTIRRKCTSIRRSFRPYGWIWQTGQCDWWTKRIWTSRPLSLGSTIPDFPPWVHSRGSGHGVAYLSNRPSTVVSPLALTGKKDGEADQAHRGCGSPRSALIR
ncbi:hypothetical protein NMY22_g19263 [Coprinellus aureogranulatus]|nr:hypothetical protein NMY22_g19263 [Coprinellus aureogranulatus]